MIVPNLTELVALRGAVRGLSLTVRRPALARLQGGHCSAQRGRGLEFEEVRLYAPGDDARNIDWRVTARRGRPHTKLFREERERPVWLVADLHPGLFFGSRRQLKSAALLRTAALLAWTAALGGDRVGAVIADGNTEPRIYPPRGREKGVLPVLDALVTAQPLEPGLPSPDGLIAAVGMLLPLLKPGSLALLLSDFSGLDQATEGRLARATVHSDVRLFWITDPIESKGLPEGSYRVGLPGRQWWIDGHRSRIPWRELWQTHEQHLTAMADRLGLPLNRLSTHETALETLAVLLKKPSGTL
ncbi:MAG: DUF58 domain-containing protein [Propionivibrio sp.]|uniref:DUF58 domain-containing protein n=1 Tax=Propionivibrio sp. TaxID=2212460 RepID=UPI0025F88A9C|nr:DUF58 domain-containing protein [Propionivibrio sp.]MBK8399802.1 DUF58 domain-containing protein [Propionivibrio sp.]MBK8894676.1 DUF58 domain-containing protein [Propionivibrio sp.]MBL0207158.1 DUF58 domain-containing protein [Propionivibrio sp.]